MQSSSDGKVEVRVGEAGVSQTSFHERLKITLLDTVENRVTFCTQILGPSSLTIFLTIWSVLADQTGSTGSPQADGFETDTPQPLNPEIVPTPAESEIRLEVGVPLGSLEKGQRLRRSAST